MDTACVYLNGSILQRLVCSSGAIECLIRRARTQTRKAMTADCTFNFRRRPLTRFGGFFLRKEKCQFRISQ